LPIKQKKIPKRIHKGDIIHARWLNKLRDTYSLITTIPPLHSNQQDDITYLGINDQWLPIPARIAARSSDFNDNRYYVRPCNFTNNNNSASDLLTYSDYGPPASDYEEPVENFSEPQNSHQLKVGQPVVLFRRQDDNPLNRYFINQTPPLCVNSDWTSYSDLSDLSSIILDITEEPHAPNAADLSDLASDMAAVMVRGTMFKDANSDVNPWFVAHLPLCTKTGLERASDISDLSITDITGNSSGNSDDNFYATGHMYRDTSSDLNPWFVVDLSPGPSAYYVSDYDEYNCSLVLAGIDLDSVGRVRQVGYAITTESLAPSTWVGPEA